jgi:hypothetical protein
MAEDLSLNPPKIEGILASVVTHGTILKYGIDDIQVAGLLVDSYSRSVKYAVSDEIVGQDGIVEGLRMSDARAEISVSGRIKSTATGIVKVGSTLSINGDVGVITDISISAGSKDFVKVDIKATAYENVAGLSVNL